MINFLIMFIVNCYGRIFVMFISQSAAVYTGYVVTEHEGNMNMGQYYS